MRPPRRTRTATPATGGASRREERQAWTAERIRALGPSTDLATAAAILGMSRSAAYKLARRDAFPTPLYRVGAHYRVPTAPILAMLHLPHPTGPGPHVGDADSVGDPP
ncbi:helix-turn-helix domain-containing protein [Micromonospora wenchangensis]|uniref:helix-turn-helix domain-containing protein n=1 Tax=Micromonospora wenchangensis TaxID=1185415 RepID=UPI003D7258A7